MPDQLDLAGLTDEQIAWVKTLEFMLRWRSANNRAVDDLDKQERYRQAWLRKKRRKGLTEF